MRTSPSTPLTKSPSYRDLTCKASFQRSGTTKTCRRSSLNWSKHARNEISSLLVSYFLSRKHERPPDRRLSHRLTICIDAVEAVMSCNRRRLQQYGPGIDEAFGETQSAVGMPVQSETNDFPPSVELDVYRTIIYLAKYQCTTAFHSFFPATIKPCKGYHFWCAMGTPLPMFDRLMRDGVKRANSSKDHGVVAPVRDVSDVALGFRCVFGHLI